MQNNLGMMVGVRESRQITIIDENIFIISNIIKKNTLFSLMMVLIFINLIKICNNLNLIY